MKIFCSVVLALSVATAQPQSSASVDRFVARMMAFDQNHDGKLTRDEISDERLLRLFDQADVNKDGIVTKDELIALYAKQQAEMSGGRGGDFGSPPGGPGRGFGGPGMGPPEPGQILSSRLRDTLNLSDDQKREMDKLQKEVDAKLDKLLTKEQKEQLKQMRERGPGGPPPR